MIDWNKPIETVDGRAARFVFHMGENQRIIYVNGIMSESGDVFLVNDEGCRCDDRAIYSKRQEPFIRNARVKREGWGRVQINNGLSFMIGDVVFSEKASAEAACENLGGVPAFIAWEE